MANALGGYQQLFEDWLPYYRQMVGDTLGLRPRYDRIVILSEAKNL